MKRPILLILLLPLLSACHSTQSEPQDNATPATPEPRPELLIYDPDHPW